MNWVNVNTKNVVYEVTTFSTTTGKMEYTVKHTK